MMPAFLQRFFLALLFPCVLIPSAYAEQGTPPPALTVTIRDGADQGVAGVHLAVTDRTGNREFARATTDKNGQATIETLPTGDVRVRVSGQWNGVTLSQTGEDAAGILLLGGDSPLVLDLRVEADGLVIPDPTMITPDLDGPLLSIPTAPIATAVPLEAPQSIDPTGVAPTLLPQQRGMTARAVRESPERAQNAAAIPWIVLTCVGIGAFLVIAALRWGQPV